MVFVRGFGCFNPSDVSASNYNVYTKSDEIERESILCINQNQCVSPA